MELGARLQATYDTRPAPSAFLTPVAAAPPALFGPVDPKNFEPLALLPAAAPPSLRPALLDRGQPPPASRYLDRNGVPATVRLYDRWIRLQNDALAQRGQLAPAPDPPPDQNLPPAVTDDKRSEFVDYGQNLEIFDLSWKIMFSAITKFRELQTAEFTTEQIIQRLNEQPILILNNSQRPFNNQMTIIAWELQVPIILLADIHKPTNLKPIEEKLIEAALHAAADQKEHIQPMLRLLDAAQDPAHPDRATLLRNLDLARALLTKTKKFQPALRVAKLWLPQANSALDAPEDIYENAEPYMNEDVRYLHVRWVSGPPNWAKPRDLHHLTHLDPRGRTAAPSTLVFEACPAADLALLTAAPATLDDLVRRHTRRPDTEALQTDSSGKDEPHNTDRQAVALADAPDTKTALQLSRLRDARNRQTSPTFTDDQRYDLAVCLSSKQSTDTTAISQAATANTNLNEWSETFGDFLASLNTGEAQTLREKTEPLETTSTDNIHLLFDQDLVLDATDLQSLNDSALEFSNNYTSSATKVFAIRRRLLAATAELQRNLQLLDRFLSDTDDAGSNDDGSNDDASSPRPSGPITPSDETWAFLRLRPVGNAHLASYLLLKTLLPLAATDAVLHARDYLRMEPPVEPREALARFVVPGNRPLDDTDSANEAKIAEMRAANKLPCLVLQAPDNATPRPTAETAETAETEPPRLREAQALATTAALLVGADPAAAATLARQLATGTAPRNLDDLAPTATPALAPHAAAFIGAAAARALARGAGLRPPQQPAPPAFRLHDRVLRRRAPGPPAAPDDIPVPRQPLTWENPKVDAQGYFVSQLQRNDLDLDTGLAAACHFSPYHNAGPRRGLAPPPALPFLFDDPTRYVPDKPESTAPFALHVTPRVNARANEEVRTLQALYVDLDVARSARHPAPQRPFQQERTSHFGLLQASLIRARQLGDALGASRAWPGRSTDIMLLQNIVFRPLYPNFASDTLPIVQASLLTVLEPEALKAEPTGNLGTDKLQLLDVTAFHCGSGQVLPQLKNLISTLSNNYNYVILVYRTDSGQEAADKLERTIDPRKLQRRVLL